MELRSTAEPHRGLLCLRPARFRLIRQYIAYTLPIPLTSNAVGASSGLGGHRQLHYGIKSSDFGLHMPPEILQRFKSFVMSSFKKNVLTGYMYLNMLAWGYIFIH